MIYRIFMPDSITFEYWDDEGNQYATVPEGEIVSDRPYTEDQAMTAFRLVRNGKLAECDYTQLPDVGLDAQTVAAWQTYRQALRDITDGLIWNVTTWPAKP
jgi:hypothetical protein